MHFKEYIFIKTDKSGAYNKKSSFIEVRCLNIICLCRYITQRKNGVRKGIYTDISVFVIWRQYEVLSHYVTPFFVTSKVCISLLYNKCNY